jgi:chromosomal replication initiation ATPase DnaA
MLFIHHKRMHPELFELDEDLAVDHFLKIVRVNNSPIKAMVSDVCIKMNISNEAIYTRTKKREVVFTRNAIMNWYALNTKVTYATIGAIFDRDHSTVNHAKKTIADLFETSKECRADYNDIADICKIHYYARNQE